MKARSTALTQRPRDRVPSGGTLALPDPRRLYIANPPTNFWWSPFLTALAESILSLYLSLTRSVPMVHCSWQVLKIVSGVHTELIYETLCWSVSTGVPVWSSPYENVVTSPAVDSMSFSSSDSSIDRRPVAIQLLFVECCVLNSS